MNKLLSIVALIILNGSAWACIVDPGSMVASDPKRYMENSDLVAKGKIIEFVELTNELQVVEFEALEIYKGNQSNTIVIHNYLTTSCSRVLVDKGSIYYIFADYNSSNGEYSIKTGTFINLESLKEMDIEQDLKSHNKSPNQTGAQNAPPG